VISISAVLLYHFADAEFVEALGGERERDKEKVPNQDHKKEKEEEGYGSWIRDEVQNRFFPLVNSLMSLKSEVKEDCETIKSGDGTSMMFKQVYDYFYIGVEKTKKSSGSLKRDLDFFTNMIQTLFGVPWQFPSGDSSDIVKANNMIHSMMTSYFRRKNAGDQSLVFGAIEKLLPSEALLIDKMQAVYQASSGLKSLYERSYFSVLLNYGRMLFVSDDKKQQPETEDLNFLSTLLSCEGHQMEGFSVFLKMHQSDSSRAPCQLYCVKLDEYMTIVFAIKKSHLSSVASAIELLTGELSAHVGASAMEEKWNRVESYKQRLYESVSKMSQDAQAYIGDVTTQLDEGLGEIVKEKYESLVNTNFRSNMNIENFSRSISDFYQQLFPSFVTSQPAATPAQEDKAGDVNAEAVEELRAELPPRRDAGETPLLKSCLGLFYYAVVCRSNATSPHRQHTVWRHLSDKRKAKQPVGHDVLHSSHASPDGGKEHADSSYYELVTEAERVMNEPSESNPLVAEVGNHVVVRHSYSRADFFSFESSHEGAAGQAEMMRIVTVHSSLTPMFVQELNLQSIATHFAQQCAAP